MDTGRQDMHLLNSLNKFINLTASSGSIGHGPDHGLSVSQLKVVTNFLRLNLLSLLRKLEPLIEVSSEEELRNRPKQDVLTQWWLTLLNFLNSDLISETTNTPLTIDAISVSLECISRIITLTALTTTSTDKDREIYSYHLLLTVRWVTNRLVLNSRKRADLLEVRNTAAQMANTNTESTILQFLKRYTALLTPLIGKIIAFALCYLNDELHYDFEVVKFISRGRFDIKNIEGVSLLPCRSKQFAILDEGVPQSKYTQDIIEEFGNTEYGDVMTQETKKAFPIMISYLQNPQVLTTFLFHYWYIILNIHHESGLKKLEPENFPGCPIISHICSNSLKADLERLSRFIKIQDKQDKHEAALLKNATTSNPNQINVGREKIINFIFTKFQVVRIIECIRSLIGFFHNTSMDKSLLISFFSYQEKQFLNASSVISAYDSWMANIIFNIIFQFYTFHFDTLPKFIEVMSWNDWTDGIFGTLKTFNVDSQLVGLLCLFNVWSVIPVTHRKRVVTTIIDELWNLLSVDTDFHIISILFHKLLVFKILPDKDLSTDQIHAIKHKFYAINKEVWQIINVLNCDYTELVDEKTVLFFHTNNRLILERQEPLYEEDLLLVSQCMHAEANNKNVNNTALFNNMSRMTNIRPGVVIHRGKYPFDVSDELVSRAAIMIAQKNKNKRENGSIRNDSSSSTSSLHSNDTAESENLKQESGPKFGFGALLSSFSKSKPELPPKPSSASKRRDSVASGSTTDTFDTQEMISMYSTVSSVASTSSRSESSEDLLYKLSQQSRSHIINNSDTETTKKRKLMAPPESKFSKDIVQKQPIRYVFKTVTVNSQAIQRKNLLDKIQDFNKKWGVKSTKPYDKPLPNLFGIANDTLLDGFDFDSLAPTIEELQQLNLVEDSVTKVYDNEISKEKENTIPQIELNQLFEGDTFTGSSDIMDEKIINQQDYNPVTAVERMKLITRLTKLIKVIYTFNLTMKEFVEFEKVNGNNLIYMELDPGFYQNHSLNKGLLAISNYK